MTGTLRRPRPRAGAAAQLISQRELCMPRTTVNRDGTGHTGPSEFCATSIKLFCAARQNAVLRRSSFRPCKNVSLAPRVPTELTKS